MGVSEDFLEHVLDLLKAVGQIEARRMFSGVGLFREGLMFGLIADDVLFLKVDEESQSQFDEEELEPFAYQGKSRQVSLRYRRAPERLLEDDQEMTVWALAAIGVARRAAARAKSSAKMMIATRSTKATSKATAKTAMKTGQERPASTQSRRRTKPPSSRGR